ncbi:FAD:protein FMN transferase [Flavobacteriaceae bacterium F08102]|nr:FAD:protein FMN transferase [Flavobacteriaceae bacterium F08102]
MNNEPHVLHGKEFGTTFNITYFAGDENEEKVTEEICALFEALNQSLSTYIPNSDISKINKGDTTVIVDTLFKEVFLKSKKIYAETDGVFDPTIGGLVNAWGFGPKENLKELDSTEVIRLLDNMGFDKVTLHDGKIQKQDSVYFDFNALAKGFALDLAGRYLEKINVDNYLIEIGGEIRARGKQLAKNKAWSIALEKPNFDGTRSIDRVIRLENQSMATSGGYRKFKEDSITGKKFIHIINPKTGYPSESNLLSVSVIAQLDCADVDGYATAILAMGFEKAKAFLARRPDLMAILIFSEPDGSLNHYVTSNFKGFDDGF